jgi:hypothetical protein
VDREHLSPQEALGRAMEDPSKQLARDVTPMLDGLGSAAVRATEALLAMASAAAQTTGGPPGDRGASTVPQRGGPPLSDDARQAIMDAFTGRVQDESLAVYGRR